MDAYSAIAPNLEWNHGRQHVFKQSGHGQMLPEQRHLRNSSLSWLSMRQRAACLRLDWRWHVGLRHRLSTGIGQVLLEAVVSDQYYRAVYILESLYGRGVHCAMRMMLPSGI
jgi:hypothetical protein